MLDVKCFHLGPLQTNCFLLFKGQDALAVDPGGDPKTLIDFLNDHGLQLRFILNTHFHFDHILGNKPLSEATRAPILASPDDDFLLQAQVGGGGGMLGFPTVESFDYEPIFPGQREFLGAECQVLATPGHTPGSLSFYFPESGVVFVGDLIFQGSIGRTDFPGGSMESLVQSVRQNIFPLPDKTVIYGGHGPETTVGNEKRSNPFFQGSFL